MSPEQARKTWAALHHAGLPVPDSYARMLICWANGHEPSLTLDLTIRAGNSLEPKIASTCAGCGREQTHD